MFLLKLGVLCIFQICSLIQCDSVTLCRSFLYQRWVTAALSLCSVTGLVSSPSCSSLQPACSWWSLLGPSHGSAFCTGYVQHSDDLLLLLQVNI